MKRQTFLAFAAALTMAGLSATAPALAAGDPIGPDKVVYHVNNTEAQANDALRNIGNHLEVNPKAQIVVVAHSRGVDFLMSDVKDKNGNPYNIPVEQLKAKGVRFDVCQITLRNRKLTKEQFIPEATFVPSGVAEITRLQQREQYAYLRP